MTTSTMAGIRKIHPEGGYTPTKQCYAHAFVLLASSSATLLGRPGAAELLDHAEKVFLDKFWDDETGLSVDTWNTEFTELDRTAASTPTCIPSRRSSPWPT